MGSNDQILLGRVSGITNDAYHSGPGISKSHLDVVEKSSLHYWDRYINPDRVPREKTASLILGGAVDAAVFEPDTFLDNFAVQPEGIDRRTKVGKAEFADFRREVGSRQIIDSDDYDLCINVRDAIYRHPVVRGLLAVGDHQETFYSIDPETGRLVKCKTDNRVDNIVADLKTTEDASARAFSYSARTYRYDVQAAWYQDVIALATGERPAHFVFVAAEKKPPWALGVYYATPFHFNRGRRSARANLLSIHKSLETGFWPDYAAEPAPLEQV